MAGIPPVYKDGQPYDINNSSSAYEFLSHRTEYTQEDGSKVSTAQIKWAEKFLTEEQKDEIFYSENESTQRGKDAINTDADGDGEKDTDKDAGAGSSVAVGASIASVVAAAGTCVAMCFSGGGIGALIAGGVGVAAGAVATTFSFPTMFDNGYSERETFSGEAEGNIETMNNANDELVDDMDEMTENSKAYDEQSNLYTLAVNDKTNEKAAIEARLAKIDPNDTERRAKLEEEAKALEEDDSTSSMINGMDELKDGMDEYSSKYNEALGMVESGTEVSTFLQEGNTLSKRALTCGVLLTLAGATFGIAMAVSHPTGFWDAAQALIGKVLLGLAVATTGFAAAKMFSNASKEGEFGDNGDSMSAAVSDLNSMAEEQNQFNEATQEGYSATDEQAAATMQQATEAANKAMQQMGGSNGPLVADGDGGIYKEKEDAGQPAQ